MENNESFLGYKKNNMPKEQEESEIIIVIMAIVLIKLIVKLKLKINKKLTSKIQLIALISKKWKTAKRNH